MQNLQMYLVSLLTCSVFFTQSCRILLALPTSINFVQFVCPEIPIDSSWGVLFSPSWCWCFSGYYSLSGLDTFGFWTSDTQDLAPSLHYFCLFNVLYTKIY